MRYAAITCGSKCLSNRVHCTPSELIALSNHFINISFASLLLSTLFSPFSPFPILCPILFDNSDVRAATVRTPSNTFRMDFQPNLLINAAEA